MASSETSSAGLPSSAIPLQLSDGNKDERHDVFRGRLVTVDVERTLFERRKDEDCFIAVRVRNVTHRIIGVDLRNFWNVIYPSSRGFSETPAPGPLDEKRINRKPMPTDDKSRLLMDYTGERLTMIRPHRSLTYFRSFTFGRNLREEIDSAVYQYLIIGLDGTSVQIVTDRLRMTRSTACQAGGLPIDAAQKPS